MRLEIVIAGILQGDCKDSIGNGLGFHKYRGSVLKPMPLNPQPRLYTLEPTSIAPLK